MSAVSAVSARLVGRLTVYERLALKWLASETETGWHPSRQAHAILGPSDYVCRKLEGKGLVTRRFFLRPEYQLTPTGRAAVEAMS